MHEAIPVPKGYSPSLVVAAFTVKHELKSWLARRKTTLGLRVYRLQDNPRGEPDPDDITNDVL